MLVITIPDWAIVSILMIGFPFILLTVVFEITTTNYRKRYTQLRTWVLKKYSDYQENIDKIDGQEHYKIVGVKVSTKTLLLSKKDKERGPYLG